MKQRGPLPRGAKEADVWLVSLYDFLTAACVLGAVVVLLLNGVNGLTQGLTLAAFCFQVGSQGRVNKILGRRSEK